MKLHSTNKSIQAGVADRWLPSPLQAQVDNNAKGRSKKRLVKRTSFYAFSITIVAVIGGFIFINNNSPLPADQLSATNSTTGVPSVNPLDTVSSAEIAHTVADLTKLPETTAVHNQADTANSKEAATASSVSEIAEKPMVTSTDIKSKADIQTYTSQQGDTVASIAAKFSVTSDSLRWSNNLTGDTVAAGKLLYISPISNGIVYTVQPGDTPDTLAAKFRANKDKLVAFNDAEVSGLTINDHIVIPDGTILPAATVPTFQSLAGGFAWGGDTPVYNAGANGYDFGQCTYWAALRRSQIGKPIPSNLGNAVTWIQLAEKAGLETGNTPRKGAVIWTPPTMLSSFYAKYGHVGFVEDVLPDGTVKVSDMNVKGWNVISPRTLTPEQATNYTYIY